MLAYILGYCTIGLAVFALFRGIEVKSTGNTFFGTDYKDVWIKDQTQLQIVEFCGIVGAAILAISPFLNHSNYASGSIGLLVFVASLCYIAEFWRKFAFGFRFLKYKEEEFDTFSSLYAEDYSNTEKYFEMAMPRLKWLSCGRKVMFKNKTYEVAIVKKNRVVVLRK